MVVDYINAPNAIEARNLKGKQNMTREAVESIEDAVKDIIVAELRVDRNQLGPTTHLMKDLAQTRSTRSTLLCVLKKLSRSRYPTMPSPDS